MFLTDSCNKNTKKSEYFAEMCEAFVSANIPFWKLENNTLSSFLAKYTWKGTPSESTFKKMYLKSIYNTEYNTMDFIAT